ncbi:hypothetical protein PTSG_07378 [Salpingoeca rosetta]|uniref:Negative elongation factor B n=1 Tax=Salpingoeca rosetta (strain ATCC 50818 / BSB-021) TaxID=946362 RepID=F2UII8_SALR5|nr:uncharacterized protein PTSG_07378 [Salpingoeca rosetta]EGD77037.1 hypothetical protein PTSG_07378 [Salpingoeca rosetta]|eukprot:XP_004990877.1 hypothetical protein PTSG_07378 [Salpingoeca rosetta]
MSGRRSGGGGGGGGASGTGGERKKKKKQQQQQQSGGDDDGDGNEGETRRILLGGDAVAEIQQRLQGRQPKAQIKQLQKDTAIDGTLPLLPLIDIMGTTRAEFHESIMLHLRETLLKRIPSLSQEELGKLLLQTFPYVQFEELRPVTLRILNRYHSIPSKVLRHLRDHPKLMDECSLDVKRQVWQYDDFVFSAVLQPMLHDYAMAYACHWVQVHMPHSTAISATPPSPSSTATPSSATATTAPTTGGAPSTTPSTTAAPAKHQRTTSLSSPSSPVPASPSSSTASYSAFPPSNTSSATSSPTHRHAHRSPAFGFPSPTHRRGRGSDAAVHGSDDGSSNNDDDDDRDGHTRLGVRGTGGTGGTGGGGNDDDTITSSQQHRLTSAEYTVKLLELVGSSSHLHQRLLEYLRLAYVQSNDPAYCHLRVALTAAVDMQSVGPSAGTTLLSAGSTTATTATTATTTAMSTAATKKATGSHTSSLAATAPPPASSSSSVVSSKPLKVTSVAAAMAAGMQSSSPAATGVSAKTAAATTSATSAASVAPSSAAHGLGGGAGMVGTYVLQDSSPLRKVAGLVDGAVLTGRLSSDALSSLFETITSYKANDADLGDAGMMVRAPGVALLLCKSVLNQLVIAVDRLALPRFQQRLIKLTQILGAGYQVREMFEAQSFRWPGLAIEIIQTAYPLFANMLAEDVLYDEHIRRAKEKRAKQKLQSKGGDSDTAAKPTPTTPSASTSTSTAAVTATQQHHGGGGGGGGGDNDDDDDDGSWRWDVDEADERFVPQELQDYGVDIYYIEVLLAMYMARRAAAGDMTRLLQIVPVLCKSTDPTYSLLPGVKDALHAILTQHWREFVRRKEETIAGILEPLAAKHVTLHMQVLDFLDRAPAGLEEKELAHVLAGMAERGAVSGRGETAGAVMNATLSNLYRHLIDDKHLSPSATATILPTLMARFPKAKPSPKAPKSKR